VLNAMKYSLLPSEGCPLWHAFALILQSFIYYSLMCVNLEPSWNFQIWNNEGSYSSLLCMCRSLHMFVIISNLAVSFLNYPTYIPFSYKGLNYKLYSHTLSFSLPKNLKIKTHKNIILPLVLYWCETLFLWFQ
jgi:hypothetical protein